MLSQDSIDSTDRGSSLVMDNDDTSSVRSFSTVSLHLLEVPLTLIPLALCRLDDAWSSHERFVMKMGGSLLEMRWWSVLMSLLHTLNCLVMSGQSSSRKMKSLEKIWERRKESKFHLMPLSLLALSLSSDVHVDLPHSGYKMNWEDWGKWKNVKRRKLWSQRNKSLSPL